MHTRVFMHGLAVGHAKKWPEAALGFESKEWQQEQDRMASMSLARASTAQKTCKQVRVTQNGAKVVLNIGRSLQLVSS